MYVDTWNFRSFEIEVTASESIVSVDGQHDGSLTPPRKERLYRLTVNGCRTGPSEPSSRIVCTHAEDGVEEYNILALYPGGESGPAQVTPLDDVYDQSPTWSPDGSRIAYVRGSHTLSSMALEGGWHALPPIATFPDGSLILDLAWSPDEAPGGDQIALWYWGEGLRLVDVVDGAVSTLTTEPYDRHPTWSPDGTEIIFVRGSDLWRIDATPGATPVQLTDTPGDVETTPNWGTEGLLFSAFDLAGDYRIFLMDPDAPGMRAQLTDGLTGSLADDDPVWSPDGKEIAFVRALALGGPDEATGQFIYVMTAKGSDPHPLPGQVNSSNTEPDWR